MSRSVSTIGGKAQGLELLKSAGFKVPDFFVLDRSDLVDTNIIPERLKQWLKQFDGNQSWAVRSSAAGEDGLKESFAGQFTTELNVPSSKLMKAIQSVISSYDLVEVSSYSVIIQQMIEPTLSGVVFSKDPVHLLSDKIVMNLIPGLGAKLVSGELNGMHVQFENGSFVTSEKESFQGEIFSDGQLKEINISSEDLMKFISPFSTLIVDSLAKLEQLVGTPVDIEFAVCHNVLYWLQVRPITSRSFGSDFSVWDKTAAETSYPGMTLPLSCSLHQHTLKAAYQTVDQKIGYSKKILHHCSQYYAEMSGEIRGSLYYNVTAWQAMLYQMPFGKKLTTMLTRNWGMGDLPFPEPTKRHGFIRRIFIGLKLFTLLLQFNRFDRIYQKATKQLLSNYKQDSFKNKSHQLLLDQYRDIENQIKLQLFAPLANGFFGMTSHQRLKKIVEGTSIVAEYPNFINDILMAQDDIISVREVRSFQSILDQINHNPTLYKAFSSKPSTEILPYLSAHDPGFAEIIQQHLIEFGARASAGDLKMETALFIDHPERFIAYLQSNITTAPFHRTKPDKLAIKPILRKHVPWNPFKRILISWLIRKTISRTRARENYRYQRTQTFAVLRYLFLAIGDDLHKSGLLASARDIFYLDFSEVADSDIRPAYLSLVAERKELQSRYSQEETPTTLVCVNGTFHPAYEQSFVFTKNQLKGIGCCSGTVQAPVLFVDADTTVDIDFSDFILIAPYFDPGHMNRYARAKGIVSERGNLLSHTSIICREMGIPSIVGAKGIMSAIKNGDIIKMNGATGTIERCKDEQF